MIVDDRSRFAWETSASGPTGTALIGDVMDLQVARDIGNGQPLYLVIVVTTDFGQASGSPTVNFQLASDAAAAIATDGSATVHLETGAKATAALTAGKRFVYTLPLEGDEYERYLGILVVTATAATNAGAVSAFLTLDPAGWKAYPEAAS